MSTFFDEILKYVGFHKADYAITNEFYAKVKGPSNRKIEVKVFGIASAASTSENPMGPRFFVVLDDSYKWAEITEVEYKALEMLRDIDGALDMLENYGWGEDDHIIHMEYNIETCGTTATGKSFRITRHNINDIDEFLKVTDSMNDIRSGNFYKRIKEAKHE